MGGPGSGRRLNQNPTPKSSSLRFRMDDELRVEVESWAKLHGIDIAEAVRYLLRTGMGTILPIPPRRRRRRGFSKIWT